MAGIHFDISADNTNFMRKLKETEEGVKNASKILNELGKNFELNSVENKVVALNKVIKDNENSINSLIFQMERWQNDANEAFNRNDMSSFNAITKDIEKQASKIDELTKETEAYKSALSTIENISGLESSMPSVESTKFFKSQEDYEYVKNLSNEIEQLKIKMSEVDDDVQFDNMSKSLTDLQNKLRESENAASDAASKLGEDLGNRAAESSSKLYELNAAIDEQQKVVDNLSKSVKSASDELKSMYESGSSREIEIAKAKYDGLSTSLQNAENTLRNLKSAQVDAQSEWARTSAEVDKSNSTIVKWLGGQEKYNEVMAKMPPIVQSATSSLTGMTGAAKAFIATPLGAIIAALVLGYQALTSWFNSSAEGQMAFAKASGYVSGILGQLKEIVLSVGEALYTAFTEPQKAIGDLWEAIKTNIVNRVKGIGGVFEALGDVMKNTFNLNFNEAGDALKRLSSNVVQVTTDIENLGDKAKNFTNNILDAANKTSELKVREEQLHRDRSNWQVKEAELDKKISEARKKMYSGTDAERMKATQEAQELLNEKYEQRLKFAREEYNIIKETNNLTTNAQQDYDAENKALAEITRLEAERNNQQSMFARREASMMNKGEKSYETQKKEQEKLNDLLLSMQRENQQERINLMKDGAEKELAQIELDYQKKIDEIKKKEKELSEAGNGRMTEEQSVQISVAYSQADDKRKSSIEKVQNEQREKERKAWQEYFIEFGSYEEKRKNLIEKYNDEIAKLQSGSPEYASKVSEKNRDLEQLDEQYGKSTKAMADLFEDASEKSIKSIQQIIDKYEMLVSYLSGNSDVSMEDLKEIGFSDEDIKKIENGEIKINDVTNAIKGLKDEVKGSSPFKAFSKSLEEAFSKIKKGDTESVGLGISKIGKSVVEFIPSLKEFGSDISNIFGADDTKIQGMLDAVGGLGQAASGVGQIMSGDIVGGAMSAVSGISSVVSALDGMFGADYSQYNKMKEEYDSLVDVWDTLISKKQEYIDISYGDEARKAGQEVVDLLNRKAQSNIALGIERLNSGSSAGSHSIGVRQRKGMSSTGWEELLKASKNIGFNYSSVADGRMTGLFSLSAEQLEKLQEEAPTFWAKLDDDVKGYLQNIIDCNDEIESMKDKLNETMTGISFDSFYDNFVSTLSDMDKSSKDMADDFGEYLKNAILENLIASKYRGKIEALYNDWANKSDSNRDGIFDLTAEEAAQLKEAQQALAEELIAERNSLAETFGWSSNGSSSQSSTSKGYQGMSQDMGEELSGRFTAVQISNEEIKNQMIAVALGINSMVSLSTDSNSTLSNILNQHVITNGHLEDIARYTKPVLEFGSKLDKIIDNTKNI